MCQVEQVGCSAVAAGPVVAAAYDGQRCAAEKGSPSCKVVSITGYKGVVHGEHVVRAGGVFTW